MAVETERVHNGYKLGTLALHPHLVNPWSPQTETLLTALRKDISEVLSTVSCTIKHVFNTILYLLH
jgi:hypothetical protein